MEQLNSYLTRRVIKYAAVGAGALGSLVAGANSCDEVKTGEVGIITSFGKIKGTADAGPAFHWPWQKITMMDLQSKTVDIPLEVYSKDSQLAPSNVLSVTFSLPRDKAIEVYSKYGLDYFKSVLKNPVENVFREAFGTRTADQIIADRVDLNLDVSNRLQKEFVTRGMLFERLSISIKFNEAFNTSAEQSAIARTQVNTATQQLDRTKIEAEKTIAEARGQAEADLQKQLKQAEGALSIGKAEADVLRMKAEVVQNSPKLMSLIAAEKWNGQLPQTMIPGQGIPLIELPMEKLPPIPTK